MSEKSYGQKKLEELSYSKKNVFEEADNAKIKSIYDYAVGYMQFLDDGKTEREATIAAIKLLTSAGYTEYKLGDKISIGDKKYLSTVNALLHSRLVQMILQRMELEFLHLT